MFFRHSPYCSLYMCDLRWARAPLVVLALVVDYDAVLHSIDGVVGCSSSGGFAWSLGVGVVTEVKGEEEVVEGALAAEVLAVLPLLGCRRGSPLACYWCHRRRIGEAGLFFVCYVCAGDGEGFRFLGVGVC